MATPTALEAVIAWAEARHGPVHVVDRTPLEGGISGARVERITFRVTGVTAVTPAVVTIVVKHTDRRELDALTVLAGLGEPAIPTLLASGHDADGQWIAIPWFPGDPVALTADPPAAVGALMARIHAAHLERPDTWPTTLERIDRRFLDRSLAEFAPDSLRSLPDTAPAVRFRDRARRATERLLDDDTFLTRVDDWPATVLHGDLYGSNVLTDDSGAVVVIDWNSARIGPGMVDIAMCSTTDASPPAVAYRDAWAALRGPHRDLASEWDWSQALVTTMFAGPVANRGSIAEATSLLDAADAAYDRLKARDNRRRC